MKKLLFLAVLLTGLFAAEARAQQNKKLSGNNPASTNKQTTSRIKQPVNSRYSDDSLEGVPGSGPYHPPWPPDSSKVVKSNTTNGNGPKTTPSANRTSQPVKKPGQTNYHPYDSLDVGNYIRKPGNQGTGSTGTVPVKKTGTKNN